MNDRVGKILYGMLFCVALPSLLIGWATSGVIIADTPWKDYGLPVAVAGLSLMFAGMANLWTYGGGLPMNAYPPPRLVTRGAYRLVKHPIYVGFCLGCAGVSMHFESATGLYLVTPTVALGCYALVEGYERVNLEQRFGKSVLPTGPASFAEKFLSLLPLWLTWLAGYEFLVWLGYDSRFIDTVLPFERSWPVVEWMEIPYFLTYPLVILTPFSIRDREALRLYKSTAWFLVTATLLLMFVLPLYASPRPVEPVSWLGRLMVWERDMDSPAAAFPSFHVVWTLLSAYTVSRQFPAVRTAAWITAALIAVSCILTGAHSVIDVVAAFVVFLLVVNRSSVRDAWNRWSERLANSWGEWRFGNFRIISHAGYSWAAGMVAGLILSQFTKDYVAMLAIILSALAGGALWGQWVEGSSSLLRPFGFYGGIFGGLLAMFVIWITRGTPITYWVAVFAMATPLTQATGRLRCLVQGCCHGGLTTGPGIRYVNPHTRVGGIPALSGQCIHNTQGYSILTNVLIAAILFRIQWAGATAALLGGTYFILTGLFRFIEESRRGEPQTRMIAGLRLYQWIALGSVAFGALLTRIPDHTPLSFEWNFSGPMWIASLVSGLAWSFGMSMDFPEGKSRFSRLTG